MEDPEPNSTAYLSDYFEDGDSGDVSRAAMLLFEKAIDIGVSMVLAVCGIVGNALSLSTYAKLGFKDTINISMTFICSWDLFRCILGVVSKLYVPLRLLDPVFAAKWYLYGFFALGYPANIALYVSGVLAGYVAVERCLCVSLPFTVKILLTRKVVLMSNILISLVVPASLVTQYWCAAAVNVFNPDLNTSMVALGRSKRCSAQSLLSKQISYTGPFWLLSTFIIISICTATISYHLRKASSKFNSLNQHGRGMKKENKPKTLSGRDGQVIRMLNVIIFFYVITGLPRVLVFLTHGAVEDFRFNGGLHNLFKILRSASTTIEFINYNVNIFIFYFMSSQFKAMFRATFCSSSKDKKTAKDSEIF